MECNSFITECVGSLILLYKRIKIDYTNSINKVNQLMNYYSSLVKQIDQLKAQGKEVKLTQLPSVVNIKRKPIRF